MREFGHHLTIDASRCSRQKLSDISLVYDLLNNLPQKLGMTKMTLPYVVKWLDRGATIDGISAFVMIAESHVSLHTFPEKDYVFMDIFSCKPFDVESAVKYLVNVFESKKFTKKVIIRGQDFPRSHPEFIYLKPEQVQLNK